MAAEDIRRPEALITPALFSRPPSRPDGRRGRKTSFERCLSPLSPGQWGGGRERGGWGSEGPPRRGAPLRRLQRRPARHLRLGPVADPQHHPPLHDEVGGIEDQEAERALL